MTKVVLALLGTLGWSCIWVEQSVHVGMKWHTCGYDSACAFEQAGRGRCGKHGVVGLWLVVVAQVLTSWHKY